MLILFIYLMSIIEGVKGIIHGLGVTGLTCLGIGTMVYMIVVGVMWEEYKHTYDEDDTWGSIMKKRLAPFKKYFIICISLLMLNVLLPNQKVMGAMYLLPKLVDAGKSIKDNKKVAQIPDKMLTLLNVKLDGYIEDLTTVKKKVSTTQ